MSKLLDEEGNVYKQGFGGQWHPSQGAFGQNQDKNLFGQPNIQRNIFGQPVEGNARSADGRPLYEPSSQTFSGGSSSAGDALAGAAAFIVIILAFMAFSALISLLGKAIEGLIEFWRELHRRYPRQMLALKLCFGMAAVFSILYLAGFDWKIQVSGTLIIPGIWGWLWLTRHLPLVFMPINASIMGAALWISATLWRDVWQPTWSRLTQGLPLVGNLALLLAVAPMIAWLWHSGYKRWVRVFRPLNALALGAFLWFLLMRVWSGWQPFWEWWTEPVSRLDLLKGWIILFLPLVLWLWFEGQKRWPYPFTAMNLLLLGGVFSLSAYHNQDRWISTWQYWMSGLPFVGFPLLVISVAPVSLWSWSKLTQRWHRKLALPNAIITGAIFFLLLDRTRMYWSEAWNTFWGPVSVGFDPALFLLILLPMRWGWKEVYRRWPRYVWIGQSLVLGLSLWWLVERTYPLWQAFWVDLKVIGQTKLALIVGMTPLTLQVWRRFHQRWPKQIGIPTLVFLTGLLWFVIGLFFPSAELSFRIGYTLLPFSIAAWLWFLGRRPLLAVIIGLLPWVVIIALSILYPDHALSVSKNILAWFLQQILPVP